MELLKSLNLLVRFLLEVSALVAVGAWGWWMGTGATRLVLSAAAVIAGVIVWVLFVSPRPTIRLARPIRLAIEFGAWLSAAAALWAVGLRTSAVAFLALALVSGALNYVWE